MSTPPACAECGNDDPALGYFLCSDCMEANPDDPRLVPPPDEDATQGAGALDGAAHDSATHPD